MKSALVRFVLQVYLFPLIVLESFASATSRDVPSGDPGKWVDTWASMPQLTEESNLPPIPFVRVLEGWFGVAHQA